MDPTASSQRFDKIASNFATSEVHAMSPTIKRLHEILGRAHFEGLCDVACGAGHLALSFAGRADRIVCVDPASNMLDALRRLAAERGVAIEAVQSAAESLPFPDGSFDVVASRLAPHHFSDIRRSVAEMARIARPGGVVAIIDLEGEPNPQIDDFNHALEVLHDPTHFRSHTADAWRSYFDGAGLTVETLERQLSERPSGLTVKRWCEIAASEVEAEQEIRRQLRVAPPDYLATLGIRESDGEFLLPIRTVLVVGRKP